MAPVAVDAVPRDRPGRIDWPLGKTRNPTLVPSGIVVIVVDDRARGKQRGVRTRPTRVDRYLFVAGLGIALVAAGLLFLGVIESGPAALIGIVGIGLIGAAGAARAGRSKN